MDGGDGEEVVVVQFDEVGPADESRVSEGEFELGAFEGGFWEGFGNADESEGFDGLFELFEEAGEVHYGVVHCWLVWLRVALGVLWMPSSTMLKGEFWCLWVRGMRRGHDDDK